MRGVWNLDDGEATRLLGEGNTIATTARLLGVSRQAIHHALKTGRVLRPASDGTPPRVSAAGASPRGRGASSTPYRQQTPSSLSVAPSAPGGRAGVAHHNDAPGGASTPNAGGVDDSNGKGTA